MAAPKKLDGPLIHAPTHVEGAMKASGSSLCSYLLALAAFQRGLDVSFESFLGNESEYSGTRPSYNGHYVKVSDGKKTHFFDRSRGDLSKRFSVRDASSKASSKEFFQHGGVLTPKGKDFLRYNEIALTRFLSGCSARSFVVKPQNSSMGKGVFADLSHDETLNIASQQKGPFLVEEFISGNEYRVFVVGMRVAAAYRRLTPTVVGDGVSNIENLIDNINRSREKNPRASTSPIDKLKVAAHLARHGRLLSDVPKAFEPATISLIKNISLGGENEDVTATLPEPVKQAAIAACASASLPNTGVDIILDGLSNDAYVLEVNARAHLGGHSFPTIGKGGGNFAADAIIDHYFPSSVANERFPELFLDFKAARSALASAHFRSVACIKIEKGWIHRRIPLTGSAVQADHVLNQLQLVCIFAQKFTYSDTEHVINAFFLPLGFAGLLKTRKNNRQPVVSKSIDQIIFKEKDTLD